MCGNVRVEMCNFKESKLYITSQRNFGLPGNFQKNLDFCWLLRSWKHNLVCVILLLLKSFCISDMFIQKQTESWHRISFEKVLSLNQLLGPRNMSLAELELLRAGRGHVVWCVYWYILPWSDLCFLTANCLSRLNKGRLRRGTLHALNTASSSVKIPQGSLNRYRLSWSSSWHSMGRIKGFGRASKVVAAYELYDWDINSLQEVIKRVTSSFRNLWLVLLCIGWYMGISGTLSPIRDFWPHYSSAVIFFIKCQLWESQFCSVRWTRCQDMDIPGEWTSLSSGCSPDGLEHFSWDSWVGMPKEKTILGERVTELTLLQGIMQTL